MKIFRKVILISSLLFVCLIVTSCTNKDTEKVSELISKIETVTLDSEQMIIDAETAYDKLNFFEKQNIKNYQILVDARKSYNTIKEVSDLISEIGTVTLDSEAAIISAESAYKALATNYQKEVKNYELLLDSRMIFDSLSRIDSVEKSIASIENIAADKIKKQSDLAPITTVREMYDKLSEDEQQKVKNYNILTEIESKIPIGLKLPVLSEEEYWEFVDTELRNVFETYGLFIIRVDNRMPYYNYHIEPGISVDKNTYRPISLTQKEYEALFSSLKKELNSIISQYAIDYGDGFFSRPIYNIVGLCFYNSFNSVVFGKDTALRVADYQIDLLNYYYHHSSDQYIKIDSFSDSRWLKHSM